MLYRPQIGWYLGWFVNVDLHVPVIFLGCRGAKHRKIPKLKYRGGSKKHGRFPCLRSGPSVKWIKIWWTLEGPNITLVWHWTDLNRLLQEIRTSFPGGVMCRSGEGEETQRIFFWGGFNFVSLMVVGFIGMAELSCILVAIRLMVIQLELGIIFWRLWLNAEGKCCQGFRIWATTHLHQ